MKYISRKQTMSRAASLVRSVARHKGIEPNKVRLVPVIEYQSADDYYAVFGANPELWLRDQRKQDAELKSILNEHLIEVLPVELKQSEYYKWLNSSPNTPKNRQKYAFYMMDEYEHDYRFQRNEEMDSSPF
jgi:hypothetical protein